MSIHYVFIFLLLAAAYSAAESTHVKKNTGLTRASFPKGFVFGTAASAYQVEGMAKKDGRGPSIWDVFINIPGNIANNATADRTVDEYHRYKEDVNIMKNMNFDAYRFSISWSRIFPDGVGKVNWKGVAYYNRLIDYMISQGITPYANLYHYDLPNALEKKYTGLVSKKVVKDYADYADFCFKMFGDRVKNWMTFNNPRVVATLGYDEGSFSPARCTNCTAGGNSDTEPYIVAHNLIMSHSAAVKRYRDKYQATQKGRIGILLDFLWYEPLTNSPEDEAAAQRAIIGTFTISHNLATVNNEQNVGIGVKRTRAHGHALTSSTSANWNQCFGLQTKLKYKKLRRLLQLQDHLMFTLLSL